MQSRMDVSSGGISVNRKKPDPRADRSEINNSHLNSSRKVLVSGYEISSCSTRYKTDAIGDDGERDVPMLGHACFSEMTPSSEICAVTDEMELTRKSDRRKSPKVDIQTAAEIEEFFSAAEKENQQKFMNKYNFDIANDVPLAGRYEWVQIKP